MGDMMRLWMKTGCAFFALFFAHAAYAQLKADFTTDVKGGCSPLVVAFTNTSTGTSATTTYEWDFGNNATGHDPNGSSIYRDPQTYSVTLTIRDGAQSSSVTKTITVYKDPTVNFSFDQTRGCAPLPVNFSSQVTAGDGTIAEYLWDFGDGQIVQTASAPTVSHIYESKGNPPISLTVTNSFGCHTTVDKTGLTILNPIVITAGAAQGVYCDAASPVTFQNTSTGPGTLSYAWNFGDQQTSTAAQPTHIYGVKGNYQPSLTVSSNEGCTLTKTLASVNIAQFESSFDAPANICSNSAATFTNTSANPQSSQWLVLPTNASFTGNSFTYTFPQAGTYTVRLINVYNGCQDVVEKKITVSAGAVLPAFQIVRDNACGAPAQVQFVDKSTGTSNWLWDFGDNQTANTQNATHVFSQNGDYQVQLTTTSQTGCVQTVQQTVSIKAPDIKIIPAGPLEGCVGLSVGFAVDHSEQISAYTWNFGDGGTDNTAHPTHVFNTAGQFDISLQFQTVGGCAGTAILQTVRTYAKPAAAFSAASTEICGNTPVAFTNETVGAAYNWLWDFGDGVTSTEFAASHQYMQAGAYTVQLIAGNQACADTIVRQQYIHVTPPFPVIRKTFTQDCSQPGMVGLSQDAALNQATQLTWDYGDGHTQQVAPTEETTSHVYTHSGLYRIYLIAVNGGCTVRDSIDVPVLLPQAPKLSADLSAVCGTGQLHITISELDPNPGVTNGNQYTIAGWEYADGTPFTPVYENTDQPFGTSYTTAISGLQNGKQGIRAIIQMNSYPGCTYRTNLLPLDIRGPLPQLGFDRNNICYETPIRFKDLSQPRNNIAIHQWTVDFGDGHDTSFSSLPTGGIFEHQYAAPGSYPTILTVTDAEGCSASTPVIAANNAIARGPLAAFDYNPSPVFPNTTVNFINQSNGASSSPTYQWHFSSGGDYNQFTPPAKFYGSLGSTDTIRLIAFDPAGCRDTVTKIIVVKDVAASFTYETSYVSNSSCPPAVVRFTNTSQNAEYVNWDFGDGGTAMAQDFPTHTYYKPGVYKVIIYAYSASGSVDTMQSAIIIKGPYGTLKADTLSGCLEQTVTLTAQVNNSISYTWDFGDGTIDQSTGNSISHAYPHAGVYQPALILKDGEGCSGSAELPEFIVIDSLVISSIEHTAGNFCDSATIRFIPHLNSVAATELGESLQFNWTDAGGHTATDSIASFFYNEPGQHIAQVNVVSPYGCRSTAADTVLVKQTPIIEVSGPAEICINSEAVFSATLSSDSTPVYHWIFSNGQTIADTLPPAQVFSKAGLATQQFVATAAGCADTVNKPLFVHPLPVVKVDPRESTLCRGASLSLTASGAVSYAWNYPGGDASTATLVSTPPETGWFTVTGINEYGCANRDSAYITVAQPIHLQVPTDTFVCIGSSIVLPVAGATNYAWTETGLSGNQPVVNPQTSTSFTVIGYDAYQCFTDTAVIPVQVINLPTVQAPADMALLTGDEIRLPLTVSDDVTGYNWMPSSTLSCSTCAEPLAAPRGNTDYVITVNNAYGCVATDTVRITLTCASNRVYIPNAFTPDNNGKNDVFYVMGKGVRVIQKMQVFNRWGQVVFDASNIQINTREQGWNGYTHGDPAPGGLYVYKVDLICDTGEHFLRQGTVLLLR